MALLPLQRFRPIQSSGGDVSYLGLSNGQNHQISNLIPIQIWQHDGWCSQGPAWQVGWVQCPDGFPYRRREHLSAAALQESRIHENPQGVQLNLPEGGRGRRHCRPTA